LGSGSDPGIRWEDVGDPPMGDEFRVASGEYRFYLIYHLKKPSYKLYPGPCVAVSETFRLIEESGWSTWSSGARSGDE
jgi:hypothetical protein